MKQPWLYQNEAFRHKHRHAERQSKIHLAIVAFLRRVSNVNAAIALVANAAVVNMSIAVHSDVPFNRVPGQW